MPLIKIGDYANGTIIDRDEWTKELSNMYDTWNGKNFTNDVHHKFSSATIPPFIVDQIGSGLITDFRQNSLSKSPIQNDGKIVNPNVIVRKQEWHFFMTADPFDASNPSITTYDFRKTFIFPSGNTMRITKFSLAFRDVVRVGGGGVESGDNITIKLTVSAPSVGSDGNGVRIGGSNLTIDTEYSEALSVDVGSGALAKLSNPTLNNGLLSQVNISAFMEWEQRLG